MIQWHNIQTYLLSKTVNWELNLLRYELEVGIHSPPDPDEQASFHVRVEHISRHSALHAIPIDISATPTQLLDLTQVKCLDSFYHIDLNFS